MTLVDYFEKIGSHWSQNLPFVIYHKPKSDELKAILQNDATVYSTSDFTESGFVLAPFDSNETAILVPLKHSEVCSVTIEKTENNTNTTKLPSDEDDRSKSFHLELVQKGIQAIKNGELKKVVLSRLETVKSSEANPITIFKRMLVSYPSALVYCFYHPKVGTWLGATPETLLRIEGNQFFTTALAGTQKYEGDLKVEWHPKEKEEQHIVTNYITDQLKPLVNDLKTESTETAKAGNLLHIKTNISGTFNFKNFNLKNMLHALHPTPAVCGMPKAIAKNFILKNENYHREFYTGFLGELNFKEKKLRNTNRHNIENDQYSTIQTVSNLYVNLRCMQLKNNQALIYVGGGITKDSDPESEWIETVNKTQTIKSVL